jgi:hypothetical protein
MLTKIIFSIIAVIMAIVEGPAYPSDDRWAFTENELAAAYRYQEAFGNRLPHPLKPEPCLFGKTDFIASYRGKDFLAPCRFINETVRHLREILKLRPATYLFPLDVGYADLAIPKDLWDSKYSKLPSQEILAALLRDASLAAVYPTAAHLKVSTNGKSNKSAKAVSHNKVLAFYDGQPVTILTHSAANFQRSETNQYRTAATVYFLAHRFGEVLFTVDGKPVMLDMSFDHDVSE